jgi:hypothetical protein
MGFNENSCKIAGWNELNLTLGQKWSESVWISNHCRVATLGSPGKLQNVGQDPRDVLQIPDFTKGDNVKQRSEG